MKPFFCLPSRQERLWEVAQSWEGTPFRVHNRARGPRGGVDCGNLIQELLLECGFIETRLKLPTPPIDYGQHNTASLICKFIERISGMDDLFSIIEDKPQPGDILGIRVGQCVHHIVMVLPDNQFIQATKKHGVTIQPLGEILDRVVITYRPLEHDA
ncbi:MAG: C40 family peptidase [Opitutales bacterium]|nr:C40 family peptidase [Opitutales bacterium]